MRLTGDSLHYCRENEFGEQLAYTVSRVAYNVDTIRSTAKLIQMTIDHLQYGNQPMTTGDISDAFKLISNYAEDISLELYKIDEALDPN